MNDQIRMRVPDGVEHLEKEANSLVSTERMLVCVRVEPLTVDVLEHEVGLSAATHAGVEQTRDAGMCEAREHRSLAAKALLTRSAEQRQVQELDGRAPLETTVVALRQPHRSH